jgi:hypothetical protein
MPTYQVAGAEKLPRPLTSSSSERHATDSDSDGDTAQRCHDASDTDSSRTSQETARTRKSSIGQRCSTHSMPCP